MKNIIFIALALICGNVSAAPLNFQAWKKSLPRLNLPAQGQPQTVVQPVHLGTVKFSISKTTVTQAADGTFHWANEEVCLSQVEAPVYDARGPTLGAISSLPITICNSTIQGQPVEIQVSGLSFWENGSIFSDEPPTDIQAVIFIMAVYQNNQYIDALSGNHTAGVRGLDATSIIGYVEGNQPIECSGGGCRVLLNEFFSSYMEYRP